MASLTKLDMAVLEGLNAHPQGEAADELRCIVKWLFAMSQER